MPQSVFDPVRLAYLQALGVPIVYVRRSILADTETAALLPELPGVAQAAAGAGLQAQPGKGASRPVALDQRSVPGRTPSRVGSPSGAPPVPMPPPKQVSGRTGSNTDCGMRGCLMPSRGVHATDQLVPT